MDRTRKINLQETPYADCGEEIEYPEGMKWTRQRKSVYRVLWQAAEPLSAIQIYNRLGRQEESGEYAVSTIYRILAAFEEKGLLEKTAWMEEGRGLYALIRGGHTHYAVCLECRRRFPLQSCPFSHIHLEKEMGEFTVTGHKLELYGYCRNCREARASEPSE
ncbi:MAG: transcriptional repressor [Lachnospiraceae bacterium]|nr:transcriptional repressor [Lachnospiraceae bacterium]